MPNANTINKRESVQIISTISFKASASRIVDQHLPPPRMAEVQFSAARTPASPRPATKRRTGRRPKTESKGRQDSNAYAHASGKRKISGTFNVVSNDYVDDNEDRIKKPKVSVTPEPLPLSLGPELDESSVELRRQIGIAPTCFRLDRSQF